MTSALILTGGKGTRFGSDKCKAILGGKPIFLYSLEIFHKHPKIDKIIIIAKKSEIKEYLNLKKIYPKIKNVIQGGKERQDSVKNGIQKITNKITLIHNGANPFITTEDITKIIKASEEYGAAVIEYKATNTLKESKKGFVKKTIPRKNIYEAQTPQGVNTKIFKKLIKNKNTKLFTDDVSFFEHANLPVKIINCSTRNFKITYPEDLIKAESLLNPHIKIGIGHDSHKFENTKKIKNKKTYITLGGIKIPHNKTIIANSDGDILIHALCNAIGTAIGQGSLSLYSDYLLKIKGITDSSKYLEYIFLQAQNLGYKIGNIACTIEALNPKLEKYIPAIKKNIAKLLKCTELQIGIACTTGEKLSDFGKGLGIQVFINLILKRIY